MNLVKVISSDVDMIGYEDGFIVVQFLNGSIYKYPNCTQAMFNEFLAAPSKGKFVHQRLIPHSIPIRIR